MPGGVNIKVEGLEKLLNKIGKMPAAVKSQANSVFSAVADDFVNRAVNEAPVDEGKVRNGIVKRKNADLDFSVVSQAPQSAFLEFGTRNKAQVPSDLAAVAGQYRGGGTGGGKGFYDSILAWVKRKGITGTYSVKTKRRTGNKVDQQIEDEQAAFAIYLSIMRNGIRPQPFFFKQRAQAKKDLLQGLAQIVPNAMKK